MTEVTKRRYTILKYFADRQAWEAPKGYFASLSVEGLDIYKAIKALDEGVAPSELNPLVEALPSPSCAEEQQGEASYLLEGLDIYKAIKALDEGRDIRKEHLFPSLTPIPYYLPSFALPSSPYHNVHLALAPLLEFQERLASGEAPLQRGCFFEPVEGSPTAQSARRGTFGVPPSLEAREPLELSSPELLLYGELPPEEELLALLPACKELRMPAEAALIYPPTLDEDKLFSYPPIRRRYI